MVTAIILNAYCECANQVWLDFLNNQISKPFAQVRATENITAMARHPKFNYVLTGLGDNSTDVLGTS